MTMNLLIKMQDSSGEDRPSKLTKVAIGKPGGLVDGDEPSYRYESAFICLQCPDAIVESDAREEVSFAVGMRWLIGMTKSWKRPDDTLNPFSSTELSLISRQYKLGKKNVSNVSIYVDWCKPKPSRLNQSVCVIVYRERFIS